LTFGTLGLEFRRPGNFLSAQYSFGTNISAIGGTTIFWSEYLIHKTAGASCAAQDQ